MMAERTPTQVSRFMKPCNWSRTPHGVIATAARPPPALPRHRQRAEREVAHRRDMPVAL